MKTKDAIKEGCPFRNNLDECQFCGRFGTCYTEKQITRLIKERNEKIKREKVSE